MNGGGFEYRENFPTLHQSEVRSSLPRDECNQLESDIDNHFCENSGNRNVGNRAAQMIARAALFGAAFFERDVFTADADIEIHFFAARIGARAAAEAG